MKPKITLLLACAAGLVSLSASGQAPAPTPSGALSDQLVISNASNPNAPFLGTYNFYDGDESLSFLQSGGTVSFFGSANPLFTSVTGTTLNHTVYVFFEAGTLSEPGNFLLQGAVDLGAVLTSLTLSIAQVSDVVGTVSLSLDSLDSVSASAFVVLNDGDPNLVNTLTLPAGTTFLLRNEPAAGLSETLDVSPNLMRYRELLPPSHLMRRVLLELLRMAA